METNKRTLRTNKNTTEGTNYETLQTIVPNNVKYAHMLIVVAFLVVNFFSFLVIAPSHQLQSGRK